MSQANSFQPWKQTLPVGLPSNLATAIFGAGGGAVGYGKIPQPQPPSSIQQQPSSGTGACPPVQASPSSSSSSSSSASSTVPAHGAEGGRRREMSLVPGAPTPGGPHHGGQGALPSFHSTGGGVQNGTGSDFLAQVAVNKLKLGKLNTSYELTAAATAAANQQIATPTDDGSGGGGGGSLLDLGSDPNVAAMRALLANAAGQTGTGPLGDKEREHQIQQLFEKTVSDTTKKQIVEILDKISVLRPPERLLLYLRMPGGYPETDPLRQSQNPLGTRLEINHTINWVRSHLEHDPNVSIPKQEVYDDYVAYCARINIKPLSTADFGKVMKQVFPGIRPRRLGTRGHSRYCYAAMRKATKLPTPKLPDLTDPNGGPSEQKNGGGGGESANLSDEESWKVIKTWAEAMLPACFGSINDLAAFIAKNNLNSPTGNTGSRQQLQKKILQREMKEKRKLSAVALKKRRKKRRRTISTSISETASELRNGTPPEADCNQQPEAFGLPGTVSTKQTATIGQQQQQQQHLHPPSMVDHQLLLQQHMIKREQQDCLDEDNNNTTTSGALAAGAASGKLLILQRQQQQQQQQQQSTNLNCDNRTDTGAFESIGKELLAAASYSGDAQVHGQSLMGPTNHLPPTPPQSLQQPQLIHQRLLEGGEEMRSPQEQPSFLSNVYCKKVRQAQQLKAVQQQQQQQQLQQQLQQQQQQQHLAPPHPLHQQQLFFPNRPASASKRQLTNSLGYASRQKRLKLLQARQQRSLESQNNSAPRYDEQGNLILIESQDPSRDEFIIPRERVISICNMDKNALDDYLNCDDEENSQDQDQELLKYFPQEEEEDTVLANVGGGQSSSSVGFGPTTPTSTTTQDADTTTGGYGGPLGDDCEQKLFQIRMILEKNQSNQNKQLQQSMAEAQLANASSSGSSASCAATGFEHQSGMSLPAGSAAASLAMLSQRHNTHGGSSGATVSVPEPSGATGGGKQKFCGTLDLKQSSGGGTIDGGGTGYELGGGGPSSMVLQSPTARRRNCSFVPISHPISGGKQHLHQQQQQQQQQQHQTPNVSPFVSPRSTPIHRKPPKGPTNAGHTLNMLEAKLNHQLQQQQQQQQLSSSGGPFLQQHLHHQQQQQPHQQQHSFRSSGSVYIKNELPASAPPSPSLMQPFRFVSSMASGGGLNCGPLLSQPTVFQPIGGGPHQQQLQTANINSSTATTTTPGGLPMTLEARSSSVPLLPNYDSYCNSSYNSVSQTPVPSEYDDFTDTGILDMLTEQSSTAQLTSTSSIKIEDAAELSMLSADLLDQQQTLQSQDQDRAASSAGGGFYSRAAGDGSGSIFNIISRSVPSTPLPMLGGGGMFGGPGAGGGKLGSSFAGNGGGAIVGGMGSRGRSMFELPKSVPSTPIMLGGGGGGGDGSCQDIPRMFQFSPEPSRDFLINGNSVDRSKSSSAASASNFYSSALGSASGGGGSNGGGLTGGTGLGIASVTGVTDANGNVVSGSEMAALPTRAGGVSVSGGGGNGVGSSCSMHATGSSSNHHHHHHASSAHPEPPTADMANLTDGIEGLSSDLDAVTDSMIDSDILQNL